MRLSNVGSHHLPVAQPYESATRHTMTAGAASSLDLSGSPPLWLNHQRKVIFSLDTASTSSLRGSHWGQVKKLP